MVKGWRSHDRHLPISGTVATPTELCQDAGGQASNGPAANDSTGAGKNLNPPCVFSFAGKAVGSGADSSIDNGAKQWIGAAAKRARSALAATLPRRAREATPPFSSAGQG
ncbi:hypothetical protein SJA_C1-30200 [Sphingobium indicum UT26S]|uniref:Uncharacterized protein n=1 Tax=Sphingobium indicum (strain DSM 16413 / CCM 7287 / MTCC 6362 / UT26 / NBRC 101211 / UT26S) TaxID=452662 RepID=D4Z5H2_SPHIU|nr:hypothetical protein SJA_C1-30200 [Sphingobium indicum UT26S]